MPRTHDCTKNVYMFMLVVYLRRRGIGSFRQAKILNDLKLPGVVEGEFPKFYPYSILRIEHLYPACKKHHITMLSDVKLLELVRIAHGQDVVKRLSDAFPPNSLHTRI